MVMTLMVAGCSFEPLGGETTALPVRVDGVEQPRPLLTAKAEIENDAAGCRFAITMNGTRYAATQQTVALVANFAPRSRSAKVTYRLTDQTATVRCGVDTMETLPAIEVVSLTELINTVRVTIRNELSLGGCSYVVIFGEYEFTPSPASRQRVAEFAKQPGSTEAEIDALLVDTSLTADVDCAQGRRSLPQVDIREIRPIP